MGYSYLKDHLCKSKIGLLQKDLNMTQFLLNSGRTKRLFVVKMDIKLGTKMY